MVFHFLLEHCEKVKLSLEPNAAVSEIYTVGRNLKSASFDVNKKVLGQAVWRELNFFTLNDFQILDNT